MLSLDHAVIFVRDLGRAAPLYRRAGFRVTPRGVHQALGTANHTVMLEETYFELMTVTRPTPGNATWAAILADREGLGAMAYRSRDARADRGALVSRGLEIGGVIDFSRPVALGVGPVEAKFSAAHLPATATPAIPGFLCQHHTPEVVWRTEWMTHPNTAVRVAGLTIVAHRPEALAAGYERLLGRAAVHPHPGGIAVDLRGSRAWIVRPDFASARLGHAVPNGARPVPIGLSILVRDLAKTRAILAANEVPFAPFGQRSIIVPPTWTAGVHLEFVANA